LRIDLSKSGRLTVAQAKQLTVVADRVRVLYNEMIERLSAGNENSIDWWVSGIASRNTYTSSLFLDCCYAVLVRELLEDGEIEEITVDSKPLLRVITQLCEKKKVRLRIISRASFFQPIFLLLTGVLKYFKAIILHMYRYWLCRFRYPTNREPLPANCTLIDLFILDQSFAGGKFRDRYYNDFGGFLTDKDRESHVYIPTLMVRFRNMIGIMRAVRSSDKRFLIQEDVLKAGDYAYAWAYPFRSLHLFPKKTVLDGIDVTPILRRAWREQHFSGSSMDALLKFQFARRLRERGVSIRLVIDWFENQDIDKGSNAGFRRFYPDTPVIGYQGFDTQKYYLCVYPTNAEYRSGVLPHCVAVCGRSLIEERKQFCPDLDVKMAPAFRYMRVWKERTGRKKSEGSRVMILLPLEMESAADIVRSAIELPGVLPSGSIRFWLKPHPAARLETVLHRAGLSLPPELQVIEGDFSEYLEQMDVLMGNTSSTILEAIAWGIPVVIIGDRHGITRNPVPDSVPRDMWCLCYTKEEMAEAISRYTGRSAEERIRGEAIGREVREHYFEPVTRESVRAFLRLSES
jgi:hypothetical protein